MPGTDRKPQEAQLEELQKRLQAVNAPATAKISRGKLVVIPHEERGRKTYRSTWYGHYMSGGDEGVSLGLEYVSLAKSLKNYWLTLRALHQAGIRAQVSFYYSKGFALEDVHFLESEPLYDEDKVTYTSGSLQLHSDIQLLVGLLECLEKHKMKVQVGRITKKSYSIKASSDFDTAGFDISKDMGWHYIKPGKKIRNLYALLKHLEAAGIRATVNLRELSPAVVVKLHEIELQPLNTHSADAMPLLNLSSVISNIFEALQRMEQMQIPLNIDLMTARSFRVDSPPLQVEQLTSNIALDERVLMSIALHERLRTVGIDADVPVVKNEGFYFSRVSLWNQETQAGEVVDSAWRRKRQKLVALAKRLDAVGLKGKLLYYQDAWSSYFSLKEIDYSGVPVKPFSLNHLKTESRNTSRQIAEWQTYDVLRQLFEKVRVSACIRAISDTKCRLTHVELLEDPHQPVTIKLPSDVERNMAFLLRLEAVQLNCTLRYNFGKWQINDLSISPEAEEWLPQSLEEEARQLLFLAERLENAACSARLSLKMKQGERVILISEIELLPPGQAKGQVKLEGNFQLLKDFLAFMKAQRIQARLWVRDYGILLSGLSIEGLDTSALDDRLVAQALIKRLKSAGWRGKLSMQGKGVFVLQNLQRLQEE